jgi:hypothetical protein
MRAVVSRRHDVGVQIDESGHPPDGTGAELLIRA